MYIRHHVNPRYSCHFLNKLDYSVQVLQKYSSFMKIRPVGTEAFHADGQTGRYEKANSRYSHLSERALTFVVKRGLPGITVSHYIICTNNRLPLQYVTQTWQCNVRVCTVHVGNWLDVRIGNSTLCQKQACVLHTNLFYFFSSMQQSSEPNDQDLQWHWGSHKATGRGKYSFWNVLHQYCSSNGCSLIS